MMADDPTLQALEPEPPEASKPQDDEDLLVEIRERMQFAVDFESANREAALEDLQFVAGDQWPEEIRRAREIDKRPCLTVNKIPAFLHQVSNDLRQNRPSIKVHPVDSGADPETAEIVQGLIRHIEYSSNADVAYDTAGNSAASVGFGYFRLITDYVADDSFDQEIRFKRVRNPFMVYGDPLSQEPDGSDSRFWFIVTDMDAKDFEKQYPDAKANSVGFLRSIGASPSWFSDKTRRVTEYYRYEEEPAELIQLSNGEVGWRDQLIELPEGITIAASRKSKRRKVMWYKATAADILERAEIPSEWIPVFPVYGDELDVDGNVIRSGIVRNAKDPQRMYNFWMTSATEEISLRPRTPFIGAVGQFEGLEDRWSQANNRNFAYLEYNPVTAGGSLAPPPQRQPMSDIPAGVLQMAMHANDNIKATTGIFDASLGAKGNETSGRAILARQREGDTGNYHYADNLNKTIRHAGRVLLSMIPRVYDTPRVVRVMGEDETIKMAPVNQQLPAPKVDPQTGAIQRVLNDLSVGRYDVTISTGPSYSTLRQEAADAMVEFGKNWPKLMDIAGDKVVKAMDWPGADEIAERIRKTIPPQLTQGEEGGDQQQPQIPPEVQQQVAQMQQQMQQMAQALQEAQAGLDKERIKAESAERVAHINAEARKDVAELTGLVQMLIAKMQPPPVLAQDVAQDITEDDAPQGGQQPAPEQQEPQPQPGAPQ